MLRFRPLQATSAQRAGAHLMLPMPERVCLSCERKTWLPPSPPLLEATSQQLLEVLHVRVTHEGAAVLLAVCARI